MLTTKHRLILRPLEELHVQDLGSVDVKEVKLDDELDKLYKPGLFRETESFLNGVHDNLKTLAAQVIDMRLYCKVSNYKA